MKKIDIDLNIDYTSINLSIPTVLPKLTGFILQNYTEYNSNCKRPCVLVLPGGGYSFTSKRESTPIAMEYLASGMSSFILNYSCSPSIFPTQLVEVASAIKLIRQNSTKWNIDTNKIFVCGFSAGGHLAASISCLWDCDELKECGFTGDLHKPTGSILSYPVISGLTTSHISSFKNLLGSTHSKETLKKQSLELRVSSTTIPSFLWHTAEDDAVPVQNSLMYATSLSNNNIPFELHIYPTGGHGLSLANHVTSAHEDQIVLNCQQWISLSKNWILSFN